MLVTATRTVAVVVIIVQGMRMYLSALVRLIKGSPRLRLANHEWRHGNIRRSLPTYGWIFTGDFRGHCECSLRSGPVLFGGCGPTSRQQGSRIRPEFVRDDGHFGLVGSVHGRERRLAR